MFDSYMDGQFPQRKIQAEQRIRGRAAHVLYRGDAILPHTLPDYFQVSIHLLLLVKESPGRGEGVTVDTCHDLTGGLVCKENARFSRSCYLA